MLRLPKLNSITISMVINTSLNNLLLLYLFWLKRIVWSWFVWSKCLDGLKNAAQTIYKTEKPAERERQKHQ